MHGIASCILDVAGHASCLCEDDSDDEQSEKVNINNNNIVYLLHSIPISIRTYVVSYAFSNGNHFFSSLMCLSDYK